MKKYNKLIISTIFLIMLFTVPSLAAVQVISSNTVQARNDTKYTVTSTTPIIISTLIPSNNGTGSFNITFYWEAVEASNQPIQIYKDGIAYGTARISNFANNTFTETFNGSFNTTTTFTLVGNVLNGGETAYAGNFRLMYDNVPFLAYRIYSADGANNTGFTQTENITVVNNDYRSSQVGVVLAKSNDTVSMDSEHGLIFDYVFTNASTFNSGNLGVMFLYQNDSNYFFFNYVSPGIWQIRKIVNSTSTQLITQTWTPAINQSYRGIIYFSNNSNSTLYWDYTNGTNIFTMSFNSSSVGWFTGKFGMVERSVTPGLYGGQAIDNIGYTLDGETNYSDNAETFNSNWTNVNGTHEFNRQLVNGNYVYGFSNTNNTIGFYYLNPYYFRDGIFQADVNFSSSVGYANILFTSLFNEKSIETNIASNGNYYAFVYNIADQQLKLNRIIDGSATTLTSISKTASNNTLYTLKSKKNGSSLYIKLWETGTSEPDWQLNTTDTTFSTGFFALKANQSNITFDNISITTNLTEQVYNAPTIIAYHSNYHGWNNSNTTDIPVLVEINFSIYLNGSYSTINWYQEGSLIESTTNTTYFKTSFYAPLSKNISVTACNGSNCSSPVYWLYNTTAYNYSGSTPTNLSYLRRPTKTQLQYIYGSNTYFFNTTINSSAWIVNSSGKNLSCIGGDGCGGLTPYPLEFWIRPIDGIVHINLSKDPSFYNISIYSNSTNLADINLSGTGYYEYNLSGLNPENISYIKINSTSTNTGMILNYIFYNRSYPSLYDGTEYFQIRKVSYLNNINKTGHVPGSEYSDWSSGSYLYDLQEIKADGFNTLSVPLPWGSVVYRIDATGNVYDYNTISIIDSIIDNASINNIRVTFWWNMWVYPTSGSKLQTDGYACARCLVNTSDRQSIANMMIYLSNRYKNHTNVMWEMAYETMDGDYDDVGWYADSENVASWQAYSGYADAQLPHSIAYSQEKWDSMFRWNMENFWTLLNMYLPTMHTNNQLLSVNMWPYMYPADIGCSTCGSFYTPSERMISNVSDIDFIGTSNYMEVTQTLSDFDNETYAKYSREKSWGTIPYIAEFGLNTNPIEWWGSDYTANKPDTINQTISKALANVGDIDYNNQSASYGIGGYSYWRWQEGFYCSLYNESTQINDECWGIKNRAGNDVAWGVNFSDLNLEYSILSYSPNDTVFTNVSNTNTFIVNLSKQATSVVWDINGTTVQTNNSVLTASYTNSSWQNGTWSITATTTNGIVIRSQTWIVTVDSTPPASVTNNNTTTGSFYVNNTWTNPTDLDFDHVMFKYINGTVFQNVTTPTNFLNITYSPGYVQNLSAQTVDTAGNINTTLVWFNATVPSAGGGGATTLLRSYQWNVG